ncbi:MAG: polysaccharide deacetylase family protein [Rhodobacteraceae bacterium]|nr:polysaccharide deacetylase family protein [Paracoccaceae bacterium]
MTFDDIPRSAWTSGGRILAQHDARATYYLSGDLCGRVLEGREHYRREDVKAMVAEGHEIGSHLFHHLSTLSLSAARIRREIVQNDQFLQEVTGLALGPQSFAYPYGEISIAAKWLCNHRFKSSRSVMAGLNSAGTDSDQLRILPIDNAFADPAGFVSILQTAAQNSAWVIALAHGVDDTGHPYSCPPRAAGDPAIPGKGSRSGHPNRERSDERALGPAPVRGWSLMG